LEALRGIRRAVSLPILAIGGISLENVSLVIEAGATAPAVISAVVAAPDIAAAAAAFRQRVAAAKSRG
jgi:thiamine-phosphate pyrophosphorylase